MTMTTTLFAPAVGSAPVGRGARLAFIRLFNNASEVGVTRMGSREGYAFRGTYATAHGVAKGGFNVYSMGSDSYVAVSA